MQVLLEHVSNDDLCNGIEVICMYDHVRATPFFIHNLGKSLYRHHADCSRPPIYASREVATPNDYMRGVYASSSRMRRYYPFRAQYHNGNIENGSRLRMI